MRRSSLDIPKSTVTEFSGESLHGLPFQRVPFATGERHRIRSLVDSMPLLDRPDRANLERLARSLVDEPFLAWTMVLIGSRFWQKRVERIPLHRRLLLLPHCMRHSEVCQAPYSIEGLLCTNCGACLLGGLKAKAESMGYHVMIAEGSPVVMQWILSGKADAILGVGCLHSLERAFDKLLDTGIPALAVPLHASLCHNSETDIDWLHEMIETPYNGSDHDAPGHFTPPTWLHLMQGAAKLFVDRPEEIGKSTVSTTDRLALEFLCRGGKYYRPFITLAAYDALTGSHCTGHDGVKHVEKLPDWVKEMAGAVEVFHKASLIHDDIEDDDAFRYGIPTLHRSHGIGVAVNTGDFLLGYGYQIIANLQKKLPESSNSSRYQIVAEAFGKLSRAHILLSRGQGEELIWQQNGIDGISPTEILKMYALKTAPAFEVALNLGVLLAVASGSIDWSFYHRMESVLARFSRHIGVAFQIKNDLDDWQPNNNNKRTVGGDIRRNRPTILRAFFDDDIDPSNESFEDIQQRFQQAGVFEKVESLWKKHITKAKETATEIDHSDLKRL